MHKRLHINLFLFAAYSSPLSGVSRSLTHRDSDSTITSSNDINFPDIFISDGSFSISGPFTDQLLQALTKRLQNVFLPHVLIRDVLECRVERLFA